MAKWVVIIFLIVAQSLDAQDCSLTISGTVKDHHSAEQLAFATLMLEETAQSAVASIDGIYEFKDICPGSYHLIIDHIGCETERFFVELKNDTILNISLHHHEELLQEVTISGDNSGTRSATKQVISEESLREQSGKSLADISESVAGVSTLKNGTGIAKPVIHGLYGNRVAILNNGVQQAGQQWGNDHAPEIDPNAMSQITVVKGSAALRYGMGALGGMLLLEPGNISNDPHLHGRAQYVFNSNGLGQMLHTQLEQGSGGLQWRASGSLQISGDARAPNYWLNNTGSRQSSAALQLKKSLSERYSQTAYYSFFNTQLGVLRGSHIGNIPDLNNAFVSEEPLFTEEKFSYAIDAPMQKVAHHFWKTEGTLFLLNNQYLKWSYTGQLNQRREFDVRRAGRSEIPALDMTLLSQHFNFIHFLPIQENHELTYGLQLLYNKNRNNDEIGSLPLIPYYNLLQPAFYFNFKNTNTSKFKYDAGFRYDFQDLTVKNIKRSLPPVIENHSHQFNNFAAVAGASWAISKIFQPKLSINFLQRAPGVNELYSAGLHQGVAGIEEGRNTLQRESALKFILSNTLSLKNKYFIETNVYFQNFKNYIFLQPEDELRLTILGPFPVFTYRQTDAQLYGLDLLGKWAPNEHWEWIGKYAFVHGKDLNNNTPLIYIPADNLFGSLTYLMSTRRKWKNTKFSINGKYVFEQKRFNAELDFAPAPNAYFLLGLEASSIYKIGSNELKIFLQAENVLNNAYRDYLNRLRYFADEAGTNLRLNLLYSF